MQLKKYWYLEFNAKNVKAHLSMVNIENQHIPHQGNVDVFIPLFLKELAVPGNTLSKESIYTTV